jgi:hypothetical protein
VRRPRLVSVFLCGQAGCGRGRGRAELVAQVERTIGNAFHRCVVWARKLDFKSKSSDTGVGPECARKGVDVVEKARAVAHGGDRRGYRAEVLDLGFTVGAPEFAFLFERRQARLLTFIHPRLPGLCCSS